METKPKNTYLLIGLAIPLYMYLLLLGSAFVAKTMFSPQYNLLYVLNLENGGDPQKVFYDEFDKGLVNISSEKVDYLERAGAEFYVYDVKSGTEIKVPLSEVKNYRLMDWRMPAPDGYEFEPDVLEDEFSTEVSQFFNSNNWKPYTTYMRKGRLNVEIDHVNANSREGDYLGWIIK